MVTTPKFYDAQRVGTLFYPDPLLIASEANNAALSPAANDALDIKLLLVDMQVDFCHPEGTLYVPGAEDDVRRLASFIFRHAQVITDIICTLDSHLPFQIFHASWWVDEKGRHPKPLTIVELGDVESGRWRPVVMPDYSLQYVRKLEEQAKKKLTIWPYHVLMGGLGNALDPSLWSVVMWHSLARNSQPTWLPKGRVPQSEHYSAIQPEIDIPDHPQGQKHYALLRTLAQADALFIAGEAQSHCVLETVEDLVSEYGDDRDMLQKIYVLEDCMSPVAHPEIDFGAIADRRFTAFGELGLNIVRSTDDLAILAPAAEEHGAEMYDTTTVTGLQRMAEWDTQNWEYRAK